MNNLLTMLLATNSLTHKHIVCDLPSEKTGRYSKAWKIESELTPEEKLEFLDSLEDGSVSKKLGLLEKFSKDVSSFTTTQYGALTVRAIKKWVAENNSEGLIKLRSARSNEWTITVQGEEIKLDRRIFDGSFKDRNAYINRFFNAYLLRRESNEKWYMSEHSEENKIAETFDHDTWNYSLLYKTISAFGMSTRLARDEYDRAYIEGRKKNEQDEVTFIKLTPDELAVLRKKTEEVEAFMKSLADSPEVKAILDRFRTEGKVSAYNALL